VEHQHAYSPSISAQIEKIIGEIRDPEIEPRVDKHHAPPGPFRGRGKIRLVILGQDPTVKKPEDRLGVKVTLCLDQQGRLTTYVKKVCHALDLELDQNIYATNLLKNFFDVPPDTLRKANPLFFQKAASYWIPLLKEEIAEFENVPILPLGEPVLNCLTNSPGGVLIRDYWGYEAPGIYGKKFGYIKPSENILSRVLFPFPHLPGLTHPLYYGQMEGYLAFMKKQSFR